MSLINLKNKIPKKSFIKNFADSDIDKILVSGESDATYFKKTSPGNNTLYEKFNQDISMFLSKLPTSPAKKYVTELFNRDLIYLGSMQIAKNEGFFSKLVVDTDDKLKAIILDVRDLDIDIKTGDTKNIDDCIYASYFSFIKASVILNKALVRNDKELLDYLAQYFYLLIMYTIDAKSNISSPKQKSFTRIICYYAFYRYFLKETFASSVRIIKKSFEKEKDVFDEFEPRLKEIEKYVSIKDIPKMLIDTKVLVFDPNTFIVNLLRKFKQYGFYCVLGPLDMFVAFTITSKYPFELFTENSSLNTDLQTKIEDILIKYMRKVKFSSIKMD